METMSNGGGAAGESNSGDAHQQKTSSYETPPPR